MLKVHELASWCDRYLEVDRFEDYCPNGLQVEASQDVRCLVSGVTASLELIEAAIDLRADALLVHHGYFWKGEPQSLVGMKGRRVRELITHGISLLAYHLPLDAHPEVGNNVGLGLAMGMSGAPVVEGSLIWGAGLETPEPASAIENRLGGVVGRPVLRLGADRTVTRLAWCSGAAQGYITDAAALGYDGYISGEVSEQTYHQARELGIAYFAAGHHATERFGVQALGGLIANHYGIEHHYVELANPV